MKLLDYVFSPVGGEIFTYIEEEYLDRIPLQRWQQLYSWKSWPLLLQINTHGRLKHCICFLNLALNLVARYVK